MQVRKQQLELDMEQQTGSNIRQGCILSPCLFNLYAEYIMRHAGLEEVQAGIKISGRNIHNLRYADDTTLMAESEELKSLLMKVQFSSVQLLNRVQLFATPWITACQASLSITDSRSSLRLTSSLRLHRVCDAIQPSHPLSSPSPPAPNPSQHQSLFQ